jgi:heterodisulfide reductase subunit C
VMKDEMRDMSVMDGAKQYKRSEELISQCYACGHCFKSRTGRENTLACKFSQRHTIAAIVTNPSIYGMSLILHVLLCSHIKK